MKVLVTGGLGYIGAHNCVELLNRNDQVVVIDNLSNSSLLSIERVAQITKKKLSDNFFDDNDIVFYNADIRNRNILKQIFKLQSIDAVIHLAGYKSISESIKKPTDYYYGYEDKEYYKNKDTKDENHTDYEILIVKKHIGDFKKMMKKSMKMKKCKKWNRTLIKNN